MPLAPFVIVTATTELLRPGRVRVNEAYTDALAAVGLIPVIAPIDRRWPWQRF
jgi:hypothetical protein